MTRGHPRWPSTRPAVILVVLALHACGNPVRFEELPAPVEARGSPLPRSGPAASPDRPAFHEVRRGETLYAIAFRYRLTTAELARWNDLGDGSLIRVGQRLRLWAPGSAPGSAPVVAEPGALPPPAWRWPAPGPVLGRFGDSPLTSSGIQIGGRLGDPVTAAAAGQVVYSGSGLVSYGELLIIKHNESWLTAYGFNQAVLVREGDRVVQGQLIARQGEGPGRQPMLHFEIRRNGEPLNPLQLLPRRP